MGKVFKERQIKVMFERDRFGGVTAQPVSWEHCEKFADHMAEMGNARDCSAYFQNGDEVAEFIPPRKYRELEQGYSVVCMMTSELYGNLLGWDASNVDLWPETKKRAKREAQ